MTEHVSEEDLLLAFDGELPPDRSESVRTHTHECAACEAKWAGLAHLSEQVAALRPNLSFAPREAAAAALLSRINHAGAPWKTRWIPPSLAAANALVAVAVAITCIAVFPSLRTARNAAAHPPVTYDLEQTVPAGYVSLPFADPALPLDDATVLPVQLSAEDLELMGVEVTDADTAAPQDGIQAEVLIGMDGWPRAIRIVE